MFLLHNNLYILFKLALLQFELLTHIRLQLYLKHNIQLFFQIMGLIKQLKLIKRLAIGILKKLLELIKHKFEQMELMRHMLGLIKHKFEPLELRRHIKQEFIKQLVLMMQQRSL